MAAHTPGDRVDLHPCPRKLHQLDLTASAETGIHPAGSQSSVPSPSTYENLLRNGYDPPHCPTFQTRKN
ncbi:hypothetical protein Y1Q_0016564 [Alligator mississippiensis]|uniref:Uncharacterized protein n=1 Tax=Alligator mississippiensis TaxID=8496 RepID=A0A151N3U1_ALLMI|nr:hypothetical protein Y1Q_0016564 [Alligator mississippiensis]